MNIELLLEKYASAVDNAETLERECESMVQAQIPADVKKAIDDIRAEFDPMIRDVEIRLASIKKEIVDAVIKGGSSVRGAGYHAVYTPSGKKVNYDKFIDFVVSRGVSKKYPDIFSVIEGTNASVSIRADKKAVKNEAN